MAENNVDKAKETLSEHAENLEEVKLEAGENHAIQQSQVTRAFNARIVRKVSIS